MSKPNQRFEEWSERWNEARKCCVASKDAIDEAIERVVGLCRDTPSNWKRQRWEGPLGPRHNHKPGGKPRGEVKIENALLSAYACTLVARGNCLPFLAVFQKMYLANQTKGQRIADVFGLLSHGGSLHPLMIEVKEKANDCWYALVECVQQVDMGRANERNIASFLREKALPAAKGVWGMVLAPCAYYERKTSKDRETWKACCALLDELKLKTQIRIAFCETDDLNLRSIRLRHSNWS